MNYENIHYYYNKFMILQFFKNQSCLKHIVDDRNKGLKVFYIPATTVFITFTLSLNLTERN